MKNEAESVIAMNTERQMREAEYLDLWKKTFCLNDYDLNESFAREACDYFEISYEESLERLRSSEETFSKHWYESKVNPKDEKSLINFYNT